MRLLGKLRASAAGSAASEPAFSNVLTPGRIPEFCIPPRLSAPCAPDSPPPAAAVPRRCAAEPDLWPRGADDAAGRTDWDPRSQAALSLPHLPRARTAYGFCALLESPHTRRKESLFLGGPGSDALLQPPVLRPRAHTYGGGGGEVPLGYPGGVSAPAAPRDTLPSRNTLSPRPRGHRLLRAPEGLLSRALQARRSRGLARVRSVSSENEERCASSGSPARTRSASPPSDSGSRPECVEAEGTVALGRAGGALRLAAEYSPASGHLRLRLLRPEGPTGGASDPCAVGCRVSLVLQPPGKTRQQRSAVVRRSRKAVFDQDFCFDGLSEDEVRRLAVRVKAEAKGRGLKRGRLLGQGELLLGSLLLL
ncbi:C2 calcium-dependent domain-containing protein 4A-like [Eptesicus fuscus]|uniref:C2 calcium-dependent domain-containing protein 4A-like n=1 Tax=Eptesicus fuscus TaxID=29078 RepID=UPI0024047A5B|nr:C2 calcium-dependent domain-containing protein 4A-like [Eptesicus fuscus]XP_054571498.1 C2 calcium-dependent domain-containing protein 4A-like [Eptesicus fuscus]